MTFQISQGIKINVEASYEAAQSNPAVNEYLFTYRITIENHNAFPVRLMSRHWNIFDSNGTHQEVDGEGVVGVQPYIGTDEFFQYMSACNLSSEIGHMYGEYIMENQLTKELFKVMIPAFELITPGKLN